MNKRRFKEYSVLDISTQSEVENRMILRQIIRNTVGFILLVITIFSLISSNYIIKIIGNLPDAALLKNHKSDQTTIIYDINNRPLANIHGDEDRVNIKLKEVSPYLKYAVIAIEDNRFYEHKGVDLIGTMRALTRNFSGDTDSVQGGSTITQQLVKNIFLSPERSIKRKIVEAILAVQVEKKFKKDQILEMYLNEIYWGNKSYGIERAAQRYFSKRAKNLTLPEASMLAGLIKAPEAYSPYSNINIAKIRQKVVLAKMHEYGYITKNQAAIAENINLRFRPRKETYSKYPYFIDYVSYLLRKKYGEEVVRRSGLRVYTTLDPKVQQIAEKTVKEGVSLMPKGSGVSQGALVSINVNNGYIQALVGGMDFAKSNYNRAVFSKRAAGSSFKPVVYLTGLRLGKITPDSPITDAPISFNTGWNIWSPKNWDGKYMGKMNVRKALTLSRNTPTVRVALKVGIDPIIQTARLLGIKSHINRNFSIVLGSTGVSPLEMATVYSTLAREGVYIEPTAIRMVKDCDNNIIDEDHRTSTRVFNANFVRELISILIDVVEKGTGRLAKLNDRKVAGKTGTTDDVKDIWFSGFTPDTATVIWMGNDQNQKLKGVFSSNCAELWHAFSEEYYKIKKIPPQYFNNPDGSFISNPQLKIEKDINKPEIKPEKKKTLKYKKSKKVKYQKKDKIIEKIIITENKDQTPEVKEKPVLKEKISPDPEQKKQEPETVPENE